MDAVIAGLVGDGLSVVLVSHDLHRAAALTHDALVLDAGRLVDRGDPADRHLPRRRSDAMESTTANIPTWLGVAASAALVLIAVAHLLAASGSGSSARSLSRRVRAFVQLAVVGALLLVVFERGGLPAAFAWLAVMVVIAGFVAGTPRRRHPAGAAACLVGHRRRGRGRRWACCSPSAPSTRSRGS